MLPPEEEEEEEEKEEGFGLTQGADDLTGRGLSLGVTRVGDTLGLSTTALLLPVLLLLSSCRDSSLLTLREAPRAGFGGGLLPAGSEVRCAGGEEAVATTFVAVVAAVAAGVGDKAVPLEGGERPFVLRRCGFGFVGGFCLRDPPEDTLVLELADPALPMGGASSTSEPALVPSRDDDARGSSSFRSNSNLLSTLPSGAVPTETTSDPWLGGRGLVTSPLPQLLPLPGLREMVSGPLESELARM